MKRAAVLAMWLAVASCSHEQRVQTAQATLDPSGTWAVRWDRAFVGWKPPMFEGTMILERAGASWRGALHFDQSRTVFTFDSLRESGDHVDVVFRADDAKPFELTFWMRDGRMIGEARWGRVGWTPFSGRPNTESTLRAKQVPPRLERLLENARLERSSAVVVLEDGAPVLEAYADDMADRPIMAMSASKSIVSLAVGLLVGDGKLTLDTTLGELLPDWTDAEKRSLTIRQLLSHTSGIDPTRASFSNESIADHAKSARLVFKPGTRFQYNNDAVDFLAFVVAKVAKTPFDAFLRERLFAPLGIRSTDWMKDKEGTPRGAGELMITASDFAKIGQLMLDGGKWQGKQVVSAEWVKLSTEPSQTLNASVGLLWWREGKFEAVLTQQILDGYRDAGVDSQSISTLGQLLGQHFASPLELANAAGKLLGPAADDRALAILQKGDHVPTESLVEAGPSWGFSARGWLGQFLVVIPKARVVGVRMRAWHDDDEHGAEKNGYRRFAHDLAAAYGID